MNEQEAMDRAIEQCTGVRIFRMSPNHSDDYLLKRPKRVEPWYARFDNKKQKYGRKH